MTKIHNAIDALAAFNIRYLFVRRQGMRYLAGSVSIFTSDCSDNKVHESALSCDVYRNTYLVFRVCGRN